MATVTLVVGVWLLIAYGRAGYDKPFRWRVGTFQYAVFDERYWVFALQGTLPPWRRLEIHMGEKPWKSRLCYDLGHPAFCKESTAVEREKAILEFLRGSQRRGEVASKLPPCAYVLTSSGWQKQGGECPEEEVFHGIWFIFPDRPFTVLTTPLKGGTIAMRSWEGSSLLRFYGVKDLEMAALSILRTIDDDVWARVPSNVTMVHLNFELLGLEEL